MNTSPFSPPDTGGSSFCARAASVLSETFGAQNGQFLLWSPIFLGLGIGLYFALGTEPVHGIWKAGLSLSSLLFTSGLALRRRAFLLAPALWALCGGAALTLCGASIAQMHTERIATRQIGRQIGPVAVMGTLRGIERLSSGQGARLLLEDLSLVDPGVTTEPLPQRVRLRLRYDDLVDPGDRIKALVKILPTSRPISPGSYDYQRDLYFKGIGGSGFVYGHVEILEKRVPSTLSGRLESLRQMITRQVNAALPAPEAGVVATLLTGEGSTISKDDWDALRGSGLAHLLAISGMNVALVAGFVFFTIRLCLAAFPFLALRVPIKKIAAGAAFCAALAYTGLVGAQVPVLRALLMTGVGLFAVMIDRSPFSMRLLALSAVVVLLFSPHALLGASFQMSFAAVGALILAYDAARGKLARAYRHAGVVRKGALYLGGVCVTSLLATLATAPFSLFNFQTLALYGAGANLIGVPLMSFLIMPAAMLVYALMPLGLEGWALEIMRAGVAWTLSVAHATAALPGAVMSVPIWPQGALGLIVLGAAILILWRGWGKVLGVLPLAVAMIWVARAPTPDLLVSETAALVAFRDEAGALHPSSRRTDRFALENWIRQAGLPPLPLPDAWPREGRRTGPRYDLTCEPAGCRLTLKNRRIAIVRHESILAEECLWADAVLASIPVRKTACRTAAVVDRFDVWREGAHAVFLDEENPAIRIESVACHRGHRPWVKAPEAKQSQEGRLPFLPLHNDASAAPGK
jgi:competence protein ComEC